MLKAILCLIIIASISLNIAFTITLLKDDNFLKQTKEDK